MPPPPFKVIVYDFEVIIIVVFIILFYYLVKESFEVNGFVCFGFIPKTFSEPVVWFSASYLENHLKIPHET